MCGSAKAPIRGLRTFRCDVSRLPKQSVAGSSPVSRSTSPLADGDEDGVLDATRAALVAWQNFLTAVDQPAAA